MISTNYNTPSPAFCAHRVGEVIIRKLSKGGEYLPSEANVVELIPRYVPDFKLIETVADTWARKKGGHIVSDIYHEACKIAKRTDKDWEYKRIFAITTETVEKGKKIKKLDPKKIQGLASWVERNGKRNYLSWLQSNPATNHYEKGPHPYAGVGKKLLMFIRNFGEKPMEFNSAKDAVDFYKKIGCYRPYENSKYFMYLD